MTIVGNTRSSKNALIHLRSVKPNDGWSIQIQTNDDDDDGVRLLRRNAPLTDNYFLDIHHNTRINAIVGLLTKDADSCQVLVDGVSGKPMSQSQKNMKVVSSCETYGGYKKLTDEEMKESDVKQGHSRSSPKGGGSSNNKNKSSDTFQSSRVADGANPNDASVKRAFSEMSEEDKQKYMKYAMIAFGVWVAFKVLSSILSETLLFFLVLPGLYIYGIQTCPPNSSFDTKKEVKRVLRGHHLPNDHPSKPRKGNFFEEWTAKITASVATEVGAAAGGYSVEMTPLLGGVATYSTVTIPTLGLTCEWIGCNETWYYIRTYTEGGNGAGTTN